MVELISVLSLAIGLYLVLFAIRSLLNAKFTALSATSLGLGGLVLIDVFKFRFFDSHRIGSIPDDLFIDTSLMIYVSLIYIYLTYFSLRNFVEPSLKHASSELFPREGRIRKFSYLLIPLSMVALLSDQSGLTNQSGYVALAVGSIRGFAVALACYGIYSGKKTYVVVGISALFICTVGVSEASRRSAIAVMFPLGIAYIVTHGRHIIGSPLIKKLKYGFIFMCAFVLLNYMRSAHDFGEGFDPDDPVGNTVVYISTLKSIDTFYNASFIVEKFPDSWKYFYGETYLSLFVAPIPRSLWPEKPVSLGAPLGLMQRLGVRDFDPDLWQSTNMFSLSPSFVGEAYANGGLISVVIVSTLLGLLMVWFDRRLLVGGFCMRNLHWQTLISSFVLVHRGDFYVAVNFQLMMMGAIYIFLRIFFVPKDIGSGINLNQFAK